MNLPKFPSVDVESIFTGEIENPEIAPADPRLEQMMYENLRAASRSPEEIAASSMGGARESAMGLIKAQGQDQLGMSSAIKQRAAERVSSGLTTLTNQKIFQAQQKKLKLLSQSFEDRLSVVKSGMADRKRLMMAENIRKEARANVIRGIVGAGAVIGGAAIGGPAGAGVGSAMAPKQEPLPEYSQSEINKDIYGSGDDQINNRNRMGQLYG